jgi:hypothetical protein
VFHVGVDPAVLLPPVGERAAGWVVQLAAWADLIADGPVRASCPRELQEQALGSWWHNHEMITAALRRCGSPLGHHDLVAIVEQLRGRLFHSPLEGSDELLFADARVTPAYVADWLSPRQQDEFREHLAAIAFRREHEQSTGAVLTNEGSWSCDSRDVEVDGEIELLARAGIEEEPRAEEAAVHGFLPRWHQIREAYLSFTDYPSLLTATPDIAVEATHVASLEGSRSDLSFTIASTFAPSLVAMGYDRLPGRARTCWRTMALIAAGRTAEVSGLEAHPHRGGSGGGQDPIRDEGGTDSVQGISCPSFS